MGYYMLGGFSPSELLGEFSPSEMLGGMGTRGYGSVTVRTTGCGGMMLVSAGFVMALSNILAKSTMACCWESPNWVNGASGAGSVRVSVRARAAMMAASTEDVFGTGYRCGNNCTVLAVRSDLVFGTYSR